MRATFALLLVTAGLLLVYSAFQTPPDPRAVLRRALGGKDL